MGQGGFSFNLKRQIGHVQKTRVRRLYARAH